MNRRIPDDSSRWAAIIRHYQSRYRPKSEREIAWFRRQPSLEAAVSTAARAVDEQGRRFAHQRRIKLDAIQEAQREMLEACSELSSCRTFHELWNLLSGILLPVAGIGELYIYDTAFRIGAHLNLLPDRVYLHAGVRKGAIGLGIPPQSNQWLLMRELPPALRGLPPHEVEDILCIYKRAVRDKHLGDADGCDHPCA